MGETRCMSIGLGSLGLLLSSGAVPAVPAVLVVMVVLVVIVIMAAAAVAVALRGLVVGVWS